MKRPPQNSITEAASRNPSVVLRAFAPETAYTLTLNGWILLEALESPFTIGGRPGARDVLLAALVMTDEEAVLKARKAGRLDALLAAATAGKRPAAIIALTEKVGAAIAAAFDPAGDETGTEKKSSAAPAGGST